MKITHHQKTRENPQTQRNGNCVDFFGDFHEFFYGWQMSGNFLGKLRSKSLFTKFEMFGM